MTVIGITGKLGSGKDACFERMQLVAPSRFVKRSFAAALKQATAALLMVTVDDLEEWKRDEDVMLHLIRHASHDPIPENDTYLRAFTIREVLQRVGTEVGREVFGENFWVDIAMKPVDEQIAQEIPVRKWQDHQIFTDCRFPNEAQAIIDRGGEVWRVIGPDEDTGTHASEQVLDESLITHTIDNTIRDDGFEYLDQQLTDIIYGGE